MAIEQHVISLKTSKRLHELGFDCKWVVWYEWLYYVSSGWLLYTVSYGRPRELYKHTLRWYYIACLCKDDKKKTKPIHRLVAIAFLPNPDNKRRSES